MVSEHIVTADQVKFEHFPNLRAERQMALLEQIAASLTRIEAALTPRE